MIKLTNLFIYFTLIVGGYALTNCTKDDVIVDNAIELSVNSYTFDATGDQGLVIKVKSHYAWTADIQADWIQNVTEEETNVLRIWVSPNTTSAERKTQIVINTKGQQKTINITQMGVYSRSAVYNVVNNVTSLKMSFNGKYILGIVNNSNDESTRYTPVVIEIATGKRTEMTTLNYGVNPIGVSDDGTFAMLSNSSTWVAFYINNAGQMVIPTVPEGFARPMVDAISADGKTWIGTAYRSTDNLMMPIKWVNEVPQLLPMPVDNLTRFGKTIKQGVIGRGCSADGSVIYGGCWDDTTILTWTNSGESKWAGEDIFASETVPSTGAVLITTPRMEATNYAMSPDGKHIAFYRFKQLAGASPTRNAACYDLSTKTTWISDMNDTSGTTVDNDGNVYFATPSSGSKVGYVRNLVTGVQMTANDWIREKFNLIINDDLIIFRVGADGKSVMGAYRSKVTGAYSWWYISQAI